MGRRVTNEILNIKANNDTRELDQLERQLRDTSAALGGFENSGRDASDGAENAEGSFRNLLSTAADLSLVSIGLKGAFDVLGGVFNSTLGAVFDQETAFNRLAAQTNASAEEMAMFRQEAQDVFTAGIGESIDDVAASMSQVQRITDATGDELESLTADAIVIRDLFGAEIVESTRAADTMMETFGITGDHAFDLITRGFQETGDPGQDLLDTLNEYSVNFADIGLSAEQTLSVLNQGLELGARNTDDLADGLREFNIRLNDATSEAAFLELGLGDVYEQFQSGEIDGVAVLEATTEALGELDNEAQRAALGAQIFGTKYEDLSGVFDEINFSEVSEEFENISTATEDAGNTASRGLLPAWTKIKRTGITLLSNFLTPFVVTLADKAVPAMEEAGEWMTREGVPALQDLGYYIGTAADYAEALGDMLLDALGGKEAVFSAIADGATTLASAGGDVVDMFTSLNPETIMFIAGALGVVVGPPMIAGLAALAISAGAFAASMLVAAAPFLLLAGAVALYESDFGNLQTNLGGIVDAIQNRDLAGVLGGVRDVFVDLAAGVGDLIGIDVHGGLAAWTGEDGVFNMAKIIVGELSEKFGEFITGIETDLSGLQEVLYTNLQLPFETVIGGIKMLFTDPAAGLNMIISGLNGVIEGSLKLLGETLNLNLTAPFEAVKTVLGTIINEGLGGLISGIPSSIATWLGGLVETLTTELINPFKNALIAIDDMLPNELTIDLGSASIPNVLDVDNVVGSAFGFNEMPMVDVNLGSFGINLPDNPLSSAAGISRDTGGRGLAGQPYAIGRGAQPEVYIPQQNGTFIPNFDQVLAGAMGSGTNHIVLSLDGRVLYEAYEKQKAERVR